MKFTIAVAALLATVSAERPVWSLRSVNDHRTDAGIQKEYGDASTAAANARDPLSSALVQLNDSDSSSDSDSDDDFIQTTDYLPGQSGKLGGGVYERVIPSRFDGDSDDLFMRSVFQNYAREKAKEKTEKPLGVFYLTESDGKALAKEVLGTHKGITGAAFNDYMNAYWAKAWGHFDVNKTGNIPAMYSPQLMRFLMSDQYISF